MTPRPAWRKSSHSSSSNGGACVELAHLHTAIAVRDSKDPDGPKLHLTPSAFRTLITALKR